MKSNRDLVLVSLSRSYVSLLFVGGRAFGLAGAVSRVRFDIPRASSPLSLLLSQLFFGSDNLLLDGLLTANGARTAHLVGRVCVCGNW